MADDAAATYKHVQGLSRGLSVLRALNVAEGGWGSVREIAQATGLHRTTVRRLLETLVNEGLVRCSSSDDSFRLTRDVMALSEGFREEEWISQIASPVLGEMLQTVVWPSDLSTLDGDAMVIRETTHRFSPLSFHRKMVRARMPLVDTASGRAYLAFCPDAERARLLDRLEASGALAAGRRRGVERMLAQARAQGWAFNVGEWSAQNHVIAIAAPICSGDQVLACINIVMLKKSVGLAAAVERYLPPLKAAIAKIERLIAASPVRGE
jgi:IclR family mhp operon transcriptional activator